jgi:hypothetical protein
VTITQAPVGTATSGYDTNGETETDDFEQLTDSEGSVTAYGFSDSTETTTLVVAETLVAVGNTAKGAGSAVSVRHIIS